MKISELIEELQKIEGEHGDIDVHSACSDDVGKSTSLVGEVYLEIIHETNKKYLKMMANEGGRSCKNILISSKSLLIF